jgi:hypothetical protein
MTFLRLFNPQGLAGLAASLCLGLLLLIQKGETRHWKSESAQFEQLYRGEQAAHAATVANYRAAADRARAADQANADRVQAEQAAINRETTNDYETRIAAARTRANRLRLDAAAGADPGGRGKTAMPALSAAADAIAQAPGEDRLPPGDALIATEQAIQLDELIRWAEAQHAVDPNAEPSHPD